MLKKDALYTYPIENLRMLTDSDSYERYYEELETDEDKEQFLGVCEELRKFKDLLQSSKLSNMLSPAFSDISDVLQNNFELLSGFQDVDVKKLKYFCNVAKSIVDRLEDLDDEELDERKFKCFSVSETLGALETYFYRNDRFIEKSIFYVDLSLPELADKISADTGSTIELIFELLLSIENLDSENSTKFLFVSDVVDICEKRAFSALKLHLLLTGKKFHEKIILESTPDESIKEYIDPTNPYHQFDDALLIISEYNSRKEILNKYLSLYHAIENFMYRFPIVELGRQNGGEMFSISDFKNLYVAVGENELLSLKTLCSKVLSVDYCDGKYLSEMHALFCGLVGFNFVSKANLDRVLIKFSIRSKKKFYTFDYISSLKGREFDKELPEIFGMIIYYVRNAIVHNKETEFHLSHLTLCPTTTALLGKFLMPVMEGMVFTLLSDKNDYIWYSHDSLKLYA